MLKKNLYKFLLIVPALVGMSLMAASIPSNSNSKENTTVADNEEGIVVDKKVHDFGTIKEADGNVSAVFKITNKTKEPIVLTDAKASCGCTTPKWTKEPIAPGKQGQIKATYNPANRPGAFNKTITVSSNGSPSTLTLNIKGEVVKD